MTDGGIGLFYPTRRTPAIAIREGCREARVTHLSRVRIPSAVSVTGIGHREFRITHRGSEQHLMLPGNK